MQLVGGIAGGILGALLAPTGFGGIGFALGSMLGSAVGGISQSLLFPAKTLQGPDIGRASGSYPMDSSTGVCIPQVSGVGRVAGNLIWAAPIVEHVTQQSSQSQGASGGGGGATQSVYSYTCSFAVGLCRGPIGGVARIWADSQLIYDATTPAVSGSDFPTVVSLPDLPCVLYLGSETQLADPTIQAYEGAANVPAFRSLAYLVFTDYLLELNRIPSFSVEVYEGVDTGDPALEITGEFKGDLQISKTNLFIVGNAQGEAENWWAVNTVNGTVWRRLHSDIPAVDGPCLWALNETDRLFTTQDLGGGSSCLVVLSLPSFEVAGAGTDTLADLGAVAVSTNALYPHAYVAQNAPTSQLLRFDRDTLELLDSYALPADISWMQVNPDNGDLWFFSWGPATLHRLTVAGAWASYDISAYLAGANPGYFSIDVAGGYDQIIYWDRIDIPPGAGGHLLSFNLYDCSYQGPLHTDMLNFCPADFHVGAVGDPTDYIYGVNGGNMARCRANPFGPHPVTYTNLGETGSQGCYDALHNAYWIQTSDFRLVCYHLNRISPALNLGEMGVPLSDIITDKCAQVGVTAGELDVTALEEVTVTGYFLNSRQGCRQALQPLHDAFNVDCYEADDKLVFIRRGGSIAVSISETDLGAAAPDAQDVQKIVLIRRQEGELPVQVEVNFLDANNSYQNGGPGRSRRLIAQSQELAAHNFPIVMDLAAADQCAERLLGESWIGRNAYKFTLGRRYLYLTPGDVVTVTLGGHAHRMRLDKLTISGGIIEVAATQDDPSAYVNTTAISSSSPQPTVDYPGPTHAALLDIPMLRDADNAPGLYVSCEGYLSAWRGAAVYRSVDGGLNYSWLKSMAAAGVLGFATTVLADFQPNIWDEGPGVTVRLQRETDTLISATDDEVLAGANACLLGNEIMQFGVASEVEAGVYTLTHLLRGRRGTEWAASQHQVGERFVLLASGLVDFAAGALGDLGVSRTYKTVSTGLGDGTVQTLVSQLRTLRPYAPVHIAGARDGSNNLTLTWTRRTRLGGHWQDLIDVPLGENSEAYEVDILDGGSVIRTITGLSSPTAEYTAVQQAADGLTPGDPVTMEVFQLSDLVGRGFAGPATV